MLLALIIVVVVFSHSNSDSQQWKLTHDELGSLQWSVYMRSLTASYKCVLDFKNH